MTAERFVRRNYGKGHGYRLGDRKVPGVTTILGAGIPKPGLIKWASSAVAEFVVDRLKLEDGHVIADDLIRDIRATAKYPIPEGLPRVKLAGELAWAPNRERDAAGAKGTRVHDIAQALAETGEWTPGPDDEHVEGYADAIVDWWHQWRPQAVDDNHPGILVERPVLNRSAFYAGTFDLCAYLAGMDRICLIDWKTSRTGIFGETALQLAAYRYAETYLNADGIETKVPPVDCCLGVWLRPDGTHETYQLTAGPEQFRLFRYAYELAKLLDGPNLFGTDDIPPVRQLMSEALHPSVPEDAA